MNMANGNSNVAIGSFAGLNFAGDNNVAIGQFAGRKVTGKGSNNIEIANEGRKQDNAVIRIGTKQKQTFIAGISGVTVSDGAAVMVNSSGQLGVVTSSARFKDGIKPMAQASEAILSLQPVTFRYKKDLDSLGVSQFGLVAEEVTKVDSALVLRDDEGKPYTVRYEAVNAMLLNKFLKEHRKVEEQAQLNTAQQSEIGELKAALTEMKAILKTQAVQIHARLQAPDGAARLLSTSQQHLDASRSELLSHLPIATPSRPGYEGGKGTIPP